MSNEIDWTKPLEAYHPDGRVIAVSYKGKNGPHMEIHSLGHMQPMGWYFDPDGTKDGDPWRIRNRTEKSALTEERVRAEWRYGNEDSMAALLREHGVLAEPVEDADKVEAVKLVERWTIPESEYERIVADVAEAFKRVRAEGAGG